jgi:hypothetical protein
MTTTTNQTNPDREHPPMTVELLTAPGNYGGIAFSEDDLDTIQRNWEQLSGTHDIPACPRGHTCVGGTCM